MAQLQRLLPFRSASNAAPTPEAEAALHERAMHLAEEVMQRGLTVAANAQQSGTAPQPRPHQVDCVTSLLEALYWDCREPVPVNYLMQHSTGSGKSFTIAALAVALAGWRDCEGGRVATVLVLNDRLQLDRQLGDCVEAFWQGNGRPPGGLRRATTTAQLASFLAAPPGSPGRPAVVLTTVQKLATLWRAKGRGGAGGGTHGGKGAAGGRVGANGGMARIAVIADEAHRHHGNGTTDQIHQILAGALAAGSGSATAGASGASASGSKRPQPRQQPRGVTYLGFTATPSPKALQLFGVAAEVPADPWDEPGDGGRGAEGPKGVSKGTTTGVEPAPGPVGRGDAAGADQKPPKQQGRPQPMPPAPPPQQRLGSSGKADATAPGRKADAGGGGSGPAAAATGGGGGGVSEIDQLLAERAASAGEPGTVPGGGGGGGGSERSAETAVLYAPFHSYTMRNAVQDGFVLDVLRSYTAVTPRLQIAGLRGEGGGGPRIPGLDSGDPPDPDSSGPPGSKSSSAAAAAQAELAEEVLVEAASNSRDVVERKAAYIVQRFIAMWRSASAAGFTSFRGMVVARSRQHVVWFAQELRRAVASEPAFKELADAAAAADSGDADVSASGPSVYGAFSGTINVAAEEAEAMRRQGPSWRRGGRVVAQSSSDDEDNADNGVSGDEGPDERASKRRRLSTQPSGHAAAGGGGGGRRGRGQLRGGGNRTGGGGGGGSAWDAALAHLDEADARGDVPGGPAREDGDSGNRTGGRGSASSKGGAGGADGKEDEEEGGDVDDEEYEGESGSSSGSDSWSASEAEDEEEDDEAFSGSGSGSGSEVGSGSDRGSGSEEDAPARTGGESSGNPLEDGEEGVGRDRRQRARSRDGHGVNGDGGGSSSEDELRGGASGQAMPPRKRLRGFSDNRTAPAATPPVAARTGPSTSLRRQGSAGGGSGGGEGGASEGVRGGAAGGLSSLFGSTSCCDASDGSRLRRRSSAGLAPLRSQPSVRREASRLTVSSLAAVAGTTVEDIAPAAAEARGQGAATATATAATGAECDAAAAAAPRRRVMTRAMSSSAVAPYGSGDAVPGSGGVAAEPPPGSSFEAPVAVTETDVNGRGANPRAARLLVVCSKYETGYDDPRLGAMFIDRSLSGARAVQVLGRLNRPATGLHKSPALLGVVDFVNSVGGLREAFEEFYDVTTLHTGKHARRLRQERQMERALARILEALQPAAEMRAAAAAAGGMGAAAGGGLLSLSVSEMAASTSLLGPEARRALEADLGQYVGLAGSLRMEMPEMPAAFAAALLARLTVDREARDAVAAAMRRAAAATAAGANPEVGDDGEARGPGGGAKGLPDVQVAVCELEETFSGAIYLGGPGDGNGSTATAATLSAAPSGRYGSNDNNNQVGGGGRRAAAVAAATAAAAAAPRLRGRPLTGAGGHSRGWSRQAGGLVRGRGGGSAAGASDGGWQPSLERKIRKNRPLAEVIAAANAALDGRYERQLASGFREICARLSTANAAAAVAAAVEAGAATESPTATNVEDVYELLSLLRRLSLWPVTVDQLRTTSVGKEVAQLRKHSCPQVAALARSLVARWKTLASAAVAAAANTAAAVGGAAAGGKGRRSSTPAAAAAGAPARAGSVPGPGAGAAAVEDQLRSKARGMLAESLRNHVVGAARLLSKDPGPSDLDPARFALAAESLEAAVHDAYGNDAASYKSRTRMLVVALKHADGVAADLLSGATDPRVMATADSMALAPASVRAQAEELERKKRQEMEAWEKLSGQGGGASTYKSAATVCPSCGGSGATVHNVLSGGTYAQERVQIQKFVCDHCGNTWRND